MRVGLEGVVRADAPHRVKLFGTGPPTRHCLHRAHVDWTRPRPSETVTRCPYKGTTGGYWSFDGPSGPHEDIVRAYDFPTVHAGRVAGMVAFCNERVDLYADGESLPRPRRAGRRKAAAAPVGPTG